MNKTMLPLITLALGLATSNINGDEKPLSVAEVLKHTPVELAQKLGNSSEAGEDHAARLWAAAKRIETESLLGKKSVQAVQRLNEWREVLNQWQDLKLQARGIESGGGTMWSHMSARNDAWIEAFLAKHMVTLSAEPIEGGKAFNADYLKTLNATIDAGVKEFGGDMDYIKTLATSTREELADAFANLQYMLKRLPEGETKKAVIETVKPVSE